MTGNPNPARPGGAHPDDVLSAVLRTARLSGSLQFCFMPRGDWRTDAAPSLASLAGTAAGVVPFHIVAAGECWLKMADEEHFLSAGDVVAFPFGTAHQLGAGGSGPTITPVRDLPPKPWREIPMLAYGDGGAPVRLLCGYLQFDLGSFRPLQDAMPKLLLARTRGDSGLAWLSSTLDQVVAEVDAPRPGGLSMLARLTEIVFIELLRHVLMSSGPDARGWLGAIADPELGRCLAAIHADPGHDWSVDELAAAAGVSRSGLSERFETVLGTSPMRYVRDWRLYLASVALATTHQSIASIAYTAGYGAEAAFSRAFSRSYGAPPAAWRQRAQASLNGPAP